LHDQTTSIEKFLEAAAAKQPTPGGGSVAALAGALAAAMGEMVVNYSVGKKGLEAHSVKLQSALAVFHRGREMMLGFMAEDQAAYEALTAARKLPMARPTRNKTPANRINTMDLILGNRTFSHLPSVGAACHN